MIEKVELLEEQVKGISLRMTAIEQMQSELLRTHYLILEKQQELLRLVGKWRHGALLMFSLGAAAIWIFDHLEKLKKFLLG